MSKNWPITNIYLLPDKCPDEAMPFLAEALGAWLWRLEETNNNEDKRDLLINALEVRAKIGTVKSRDLAIKALGIEVKYFEYFKKGYDCFHKYLTVLLQIRPQTDGLKYPHESKYKKLVNALEYTVPISVKKRIVIVHEISKILRIGMGMQINNYKYQPQISNESLAYFIKRFTKNDFAGVKIITDNDDYMKEITSIRTEEKSLSIFCITDHKDKPQRIMKIHLLLKDKSVFIEQNFEDGFVVQGDSTLLSFTISLDSSNLGQVYFTPPPVYLYDYMATIADCLREARELKRRLELYIAHVSP